jgi:hypothetical protein
MLTQDAIREFFEYRDGMLYNRFTRGPKAVKGSDAGSLDRGTGYWRVNINKKGYQLSRLIWIYFSGDIPKGMVIDHINRDTQDNRITNLRLSTYTQNEWNKPRSGCSFEKGKWRARIKDHGKNVHLGLFDTEAEAIAAYQEYAASLHGEYQCA